MKITVRLQSQVYRMKKSLRSLMMHEYLAVVRLLTPTEQN